MALNVLLVEPDAGLTEEIRRAFGPVGFSITALPAGEGAVERCKDSPPDLILLAAELPDMSGFSVCNRLKRALSSVPLILYTAEATDAAIEAHRATRTRADDYMKRPFEVADLLSRAAALLQSDRPSPPPPHAPPAPPRPDGSRSHAPADADAPPVLQRVDSGQVAARGVAALEAAAPAALAVRPPRSAPPPMPGRAPGKPPAPVAKVKVASPAREGKRDPFDLLADAPRDPAPPKGTPEAKLEYFRERLRARDAFIGKVRDAVADMKAFAAELAAERDVLQRELAHEREKALDLEHRLGEAGQDAAAQAARVEDLRRQLEESDTTRQSLSDVLSETMQQHESAEQAWSARIAGADAERARLEAELAEQAEAHARAVAALEADRADERARAEASRAEAAESHAQALAAERDDRERERADAGARLQLAEERITALGVQRDGLEAEVARREQDAQAKAQHEAARAREADDEARMLRARIDEASGRAEAVAGELADARGRIAALEEEGVRAAAARGALEEELRQARAEARAYDEKAVAAERAFQAKAGELEAAGRRIEDLSSALEEGRASAEGTLGELARVDAARAEADRRAAELQADREQLAREVETARREHEAARDQIEAERRRTRTLEAEVARLAKLEPVAEEALRLRKEVASLRELVQQRTGAAESAARAAEAAQAERARADERLAAEGGRLQAQLSRAEGELAISRRRVQDLEREGAAREAALRKAGEEAEGRRRSLATDAAEAERRHGAEAARLRAAMVDLERHLEARARAELQLKRKVQELERSAQARPAQAPADPAELARLKAQLAKHAEQIEELRGENDFLNGEVARYVQKNKDLLGQLASLRET